MSSTSSNILRDLMEYLPPVPLPSIDARIRWWQGRIDSATATGATPQPTSGGAADPANTHAYNPSSTPPTSSLEAQATGSEQDGNEGAAPADEGRQSSSSDSTRGAASSRSSMLEAEVKRLWEAMDCLACMNRQLTMNLEDLTRERSKMRARLRIYEEAESVSS